MAVEIAIVLGLISLFSFFVYVAFTLDKKYTPLKYLFFIVSISFLLASIGVIADIANNYTLDIIANSTYNSTSGETIYTYNSTKPYQSVANALFSYIPIISLVLYLVIAIFLIMFISSLLQFIKDLGLKR